MGFVEFQESKIIELHNIFVKVCKQMAKDSYGIKYMPPKQQDHFLRLYAQFKSMLPFMTEKNIYENESEDVNKILDLPHIDKLKDKLAERLKNSTLTTNLPDLMNPMRKTSNNLGLAD